MWWITPLIFKTRGNFHSVYSAVAWSCVLLSTDIAKLSKKFHQALLKKALHVLSTSVLNRLKTETNHVLRKCNSKRGIQLPSDKVASHSYTRVSCWVTRVRGVLHGWEDFQPSLVTFKFSSLLEWPAFQGACQLLWFPFSVLLQQGRLFFPDLCLSSAPWTSAHPWRESSDITSFKEFFLDSSWSGSGEILLL